ncbi:branched-chain amino acid transport system ATP-binding protein [Ochrobactrum sp. 19YEA23]|uniref:ABC transporter ATP-binding protein n=1 Tax=Ochrobactrum sp. 19YEA23 TaxID=3039854 RepID=UPI002479A753|nr:branched-chain amino acid transport system ATP-binding protein [Ochrobactrum sp. 19YEA23]
MSHMSLIAKDIQLAFGGIKVLQGPSLELNAGEITGLIGPNGAGKTSLFNCLAGAYRPQSGSISFAGEELCNMPSAARAERGIVRSFQTVALCPDLTVVENVMMGLARNYKSGWLNAFLPMARGHREREEMRAQAITALEGFGLAHVADELPAQLPPGNQRLVEIARAIVGKPKVLLLDEPAAGLNNSETRDLALALENLVSPELVMVVVEHDMDLVMSLCDRIHVLNFGQLVASGTPDEVRNDPEVIRIYLGGDDD